ncbi:PREDICTED: ataxin-2 homolog [Polistes dominula]|uniref:Ataxin-2 homolog n=1 Tax=Polistes dominula TaxID=743375 RepID=A0ABM1J9B6_POLDO|nr:PREDICTED: ataxin-2 homolog [Polistes dominula]
MRAILLMSLVTLASINEVVSEYLMGGHLDNNDPKTKTQTNEHEYISLGRSSLLDALDLDLDAEESTVGSFSLAKDDEGPRYGPPFSFAFNGGRPFSLEKDPITGKIDYEKAPAVRILNYTDRYEESDDNDEDKETSEEALKEDADLHTKEMKKIENKDPEDVSPNEINPNSPSFHDFLNLPVRYSSDKYTNDKYPLISSSYANTKVQSGLNSYSTYNHRPYHRETTLYYPVKKTHVPKISTSTTTTTTTTTTTSTTTMKPTTLRPSTTSTTVPTTTTTTTTTTTPSTTTSTTTKAPPVTTWKPSSTSTVRYTADNSNNYEDILSSFNVPMKTFQETINFDHQSPNNLAGSSHREPSVVQLPPKKEEYDMYDDYDMHEESNEEQDYSFDKEVSKEPISSTTMSAPPSTTPSTIQSTTNTPESTTMRPTISFSTPVPSSPSNNIVSTHPLQFQVVPHPVTSMSIDSDDREIPTFENVVDNRRPGMFDGMISNVGGHQIINQRPLGMGGQILVGSTSNIVVPPDQDTVSFVLGNRQNVEGGGYYSPGTAIGENPYGGLTGAEASFRPLYGEVSTDQDGYELETDPQRTVALPSVAVEPNFGYNSQKRWPSNSGPPLKNNNEIESSKVQPSIVRGTVLMEQKDVRNEEKDTNRVAFPKPEEEKHPVEEHIVIINEADGTVQEFPPSTTILPSKINNKPDSVSTIDDHLPQLSENLTPPAERPRPPPSYYFHYQHGGTIRPEYPRPPQRLPLPPARGKPFPPPPLPPPVPDTLAIRRRPYPSDTKLPNILPQFRPNAKVSHGHRNTENIGTIPAPQPYLNRVRQTPHVHPPSRRPLPPAPSYLQRLNPPPPPIHTIRLAGSSSTIAENVAPVQESEPPMVKRFRYPSAVQPTSRGENDESTNQPNRLPGQKQKLRLEDEETSERYSEEPPQTPPRPPLFPRRRTADPPRVTTLQMIQQRGELEEDEEATGLATSSNNDPDQEVKITIGQEIEHRKDVRDSVAEPPVYVVYPVNTAVNIDPDDSGDKDESVVVGTRGPHRPLPPETLLRDDKDREKINEEESTMVDLYNGRPVGDFSYSLDRVDPSIYAGPVRETPILVPSDQRHENRPLNERDEEKEDSDHVNVIPYLQDFVPFSRKKNEGVISATLHRMPSSNNHPSSTPIAYVYTPTAEASHHRLDVDVKDDGSKMNRNDQRPVLLPSQQPSSSSSSAPSPQNFMAPFVASLRAEAPAKNGWNVVVIESKDKTTSDDEKTDDVVDADDDESSKKSEFDPENFKPQLFGGFKPIFEFPIDNDDNTEKRESNNSNSSISKNIQQEAVDSAA